jgi:hypothetical protein
MLLGETGAPIVSEGAGTAATKVEAKHRIAVQMVSFIIVCDKKIGTEKRYCGVYLNKGLNV